MDGNRLERKKGSSGKRGRKFDARKPKKRDGGKQGKRTAEDVGRHGRGRRQYIAALFVIAVVVMAAFFTPQIMFWIQDGVLHRRTELGRQDPMDVEALSSGYEKNTYQRMLNFAEGLALGDSFYVTFKNLAVNGDSAELEEYLRSGYLYEGIPNYMAALDLVPLYVFEYGYTLSQWKQYVVYSDNYAKGVNFILWYIELVYSDGIKLKLLTDAQTGTLYALKTQDCQWAESSYPGAKYKELLERGGLIELWLLCGAQFGVFSTDEQLKDLAAGMAETESDMERTDRVDDFQKYFYGIWNLHGNTDVIVHGQPSLEEKSYAAIMEYIKDKVDWDLENRFARLRLPYKTASLEVFVELGEMESEEKGMSYMYPDFTIGVRQLYEMIPEFLQ